MPPAKFDSRKRAAGPSCVPVGHRVSRQSRATRTFSRAGGTHPPTLCPTCVLSGRVTARVRTAVPRRDQVIFGLPPTWDPRDPPALTERNPGKVTICAHVVRSCMPVATGRAQPQHIAAKAPRRARQGPRSPPASHPRLRGVDMTAGRVAPRTIASVASPSRRRAPARAWCPLACRDRGTTASVEGSSGSRESPDQPAHKPASLLVKPHDRINLTRCDSSLLRSRSAQITSDSAFYGRARRVVISNQSRRGDDQVFPFFFRSWPAL